MAAPPGERAYGKNRTDLDSSLIAVTIVALSAAVQIGAGVLSLKLIPISGRKLAWSLIAAALFGMSGRRLMSLAAIVADGHPATFMIEYELLGLATSLLMFAGVNLIKPIFLDLRESQASLQEALSKVKVLSGLIPICASCKKIRDDKGYWTQLEQYISAHSDADFTHGYCPECKEAILDELKRHRGGGPPTDRAKLSE